MSSLVRAAWTGWKYLRSPIDARGFALDVTDPTSVDEFCEQVRECHLLVNNAGGALGLDSVAESKDDRWAEMYERNVMGTMRMTRALLPKLIDSGDGHIVNVGSVSAFETYPGGAGYTAAKHALRALTKTLRAELLGQPIRITQVDPGAVETEFSIVRFEGDESRAAGVYEGMTPLTGEDIADCIVWAATRPSHVNIDQIHVMPRDQAGARFMHRATD